MPSSCGKRPRTEGVSVNGKKGKGKFADIDAIIRDKGARKLFNDRWTPELLALFAEDNGGEYRLRGGQLSLQFEGGWGNRTEAFRDSSANWNVGGTRSAGTLKLNRHREVAHR